MKTVSLFCVLITLMSFTFTVSAQKKQFLNTKIIDSLMLVENTDQASSTLEQQLAYIKKEKLNDSLHNYIYYVGKIELSISNSKTAISKAEDFLNYITSNTNSKTTHYKSLLKLADFYDELGKNQKSLKVTQKALQLVKQVKNATPENIGMVEYNLGASLLSLGNLNEAKSYFQNALQRFEAYEQTSKTQLSDAYNAVGATMWMSSKLDSAKYFYTRAVNTIENAQGDLLLHQYQGTVIKSNISLLEYSQGNLAEAIKTQNEVILNYENTINNYNDENIVSKAKRYQNRAISNMAVFYNEQGNLEKAHDLIMYSYEKKKKLQETNDFDLGSTLIQIGQSKISLQDYDEAIAYLHDGIEQLKLKASNNPYWLAAGLHALAEAYAAKKNVASAKMYYEQSEQFFKEALGDDYDIEFLNFLRNKSLFLAENNEPNEALITAKNAYDYVLKNGGDDNFSLLKQLINLASVSYKLGDYQQTLTWADKANQFLNKSSTLADEHQLNFNKPQLILLQSLAQYELESNKNIAFLKQQIQDLREATAILEERKTTIYKNEDLNILMSDYHEISNVSKKLTLELYEKTKDRKDLNTIIMLHESGIYNRIRSRLNLKNNISFSNIPQTILEREATLKNELAVSLDASEDIQTFISTNDQWNTFLNALKTDYPKYYKMRYATIEESLDGLQKNVPEHTTIVRYLFISDDLYAFVFDRTKSTFHKLTSEHLNENIDQLSQAVLDEDTTKKTLHSLYNALWKPFENEITTSKVVVIPDRELFNLSFESLTPEEIESFDDISDSCLLSRYIISYNYSLYLLDDNRKTVDYNKDFIAFAPEFNDSMKDNYKINITDSITLDKTYLRLLPQPFTADLVKEHSKRFEGEAFTNENASKQLFTSEAKEHKIIHIGTHAESNNISPELSRLIFAKNVSDSLSTEDNSLYTYEIYNQNLSSNLAILTACETGKPTYQAGEGMISLAHAFNYAGSESIMTSLWKIDEQSSAQIIAHFYKYIKKGLSKDEALQKAKLDYISSANGRTIAPQYWAGLVLIGDTSPIPLQRSTNLAFWLSIAIVFIILFVVILRKRGTTE